MSEHAKLGYIGLGNMGAPMAKRLVEWPGGVTVFDVRAEAMTPLVEAGATLADSVADVATADVALHERSPLARLVLDARRRFLENDIG